jgi:hypothetical protein
MLRIGKSPFEMRFERGGGALTIARLDIWMPTDTDWQSMGSFTFTDSAQATEMKQGNLPPGDYTCIFQCFVEESLNGKYSFTFSVVGKPTYQDDGDVNASSAKNESKVFRDQFVLRITQ